MNPSAPLTALEPVSLRLRAPAACQVDMGPEYHGRFLEVCQLLGIRVDVVGVSAKLKHGLSERGAVAKLMLTRMIPQLAITTFDELRVAVAVVKNRSGRCHGLSPSSGAT